MAITKEEFDMSNPTTEGLESCEIELNNENEFEEHIVYSFPPLDILVKGESNSSSAKELKEMALRVQQVLNSFEIYSTVIEVTQSPLVTRFVIQLALGIRISKIIRLKDDIRLSLAVTDIRIEAPIHGKSAIAIEIPNKVKTILTLRDLLESKEFNEFPSNTAFVAGKDIAGKIVVTDIAKMPHILIAGTTGSGKSVFIDTIIMSIIYKAHPDNVKIIMIDTKGVTLSIYNGIPHLLNPVVTDAKKAPSAIYWAITEMTERYRRFSGYNVRNLKEYNEKVDVLNLKENAYKHEKLPQILIIIDDLSDLMAVNPTETENGIVRLAQMSRAAGIHLVISTQRPSTNVVTGLIKANIPSRVAFSVFSSVDSRVILDESGAEELLGNGDMLFKTLGYLKPTRIQGAYISEKEILNVVNFLKAQNPNSNNFFTQKEKKDTIKLENCDNYFIEAGRLIINKDKVSIAMLQRHFEIGFNRAIRIVDELCEAGVIGEEAGTKPRKVLMNIEEFEKCIEIFSAK